MRNYLLIDADDTLWENNIYFEQATHDFIAFLNHSPLSPEEVRVVLDGVERLMGYGSLNFTRSLVETYRRVAETRLQRRMCNGFGSSENKFSTTPCSCLMVSKDTRLLIPRHDLMLLTKGAVEEQS